jgi:hypothetical protein
VLGVAVLLAAVPAMTLAATADGLPAWIDSVSRVGVVGLLTLALFGLHRGWWVPGRYYSELVTRHAGCTARYDEAIEIALQSSRGVQRTASVIEQALARGQGQG